MCLQIYQFKSNQKPVSYIRNINKLSYAGNDNDNDDDNDKVHKAHFKHQMRRSQTNEYIFNSPENDCTFSAGSRKATGRAFQTRGPAAENALVAKRSTGVRSQQQMCVGR